MGEDYTFTTTDIADLAACTGETTTQVAEVLAQSDTGSLAKRRRRYYFLRLLQLYRATLTAPGTGS